MLGAVYFSGGGYWIVSILLFAFGIWVAVDASKYPDWAFQRAGTQKWLFQILTPIAGLLCGIVTIVLGIIWFASKKTQVEQASQSGPSEGSYGAGGPYGASQPPASTWGPPPAPGGWTPPPPPPAQGPATPPPPVPPVPDDPTGSPS